MRFALAALLALAACNQVFDLRSTDLIDAGHPFFDAAPQVPACPAFGTPLVFGSQLTQAVHQHCVQYMPSFALQLAIAECYENYYSYLYEGRLDGELARVQGDAACDSMTELCYGERLVPEGSDLFQYRYTYADATYHYNRYHRGADGVWHFVAEVKPPPNAFMTADYYSQPTRLIGGTRRMFAFAAEDPPLVEYVSNETDHTWMEVGAYTLDELKTTTLLAPRLSEDGLRLVFRAYDPTTMTYQIKITERASIDDRFGPPVPLAGIPDVSETLLSPDCERAYFPGLDSIFYQTRQH